MTIFYSGASLVGAFSGLLAYGIGQLDYTWGYRGRRFIYLVEGLFSFCVALAAFLFLLDNPSKVKTWLSNEERQYLVLRSRSATGGESGIAEKDTFSWNYAKQAFKSPHTYFIVHSGDARIKVLSAKESAQYLANRRLQRPVSPHLGIYKWQMGSVLSSLMRITGVIYSGSFYLFGLAYFASPYLGWDLCSATFAAAFGSLPFAAKSAVKFVVAWPFVLHCINGVRHLTWDTARGFNNSYIMKTGWAAVSATTLSVVYMVFFMG
ncbi:hypothetical protein MBLNU459_g5960t1 [Dothideomycetes sp. NU459]